MSTISVKTHFSAGHRILGLDGEGAKCRNIHGHTFYVTWVFWQEQGQLKLEFGELKMRLRSLIAHHFDHAFILDIRDDFNHYLDVNQLKHYQLEGPPTTEAIAAEIATLTIDRLTKPAPADRFHRDELPALWPDAKLLRVELQEGPDNAACWEAQRYSSERSLTAAASASDSSENPPL
jgi:6-pyruvoyl-tetrahydropterin synthase